MDSEKKQRLIQKARDNPEWWIETVLGWRPWATQRQIIRSAVSRRKTRVASCHSIGKSTLAAGCGLFFLSNYRPSMVLATATSARQVTGILCREFRKQHRKAKMPLGGRMMHQSWDLNDDRWFKGFTAPEYDPDRFAGFHSENTLVIIDEAAGVSETVYEGMESAMSQGNAHMLEIGNPTDSTGMFGQGFSTDDGAELFIVSCFDTPNFTEFGITIDDIRENTWEQKIDGHPLPAPYLVNPQWVRERWATWTRNGADEEDPRWMSRCLARFPTAGARAAIPEWWIDEAFDRWKKMMNSGQKWEGEKRLGCDVARFGQDGIFRAEFYADSGLKKMYSSPKQGTMETAGEIVAQSKEGFRSIRIDADGLGAGIYDRVAEQIDTAVEIRSGMSPMNKERFTNRRSEMWWDLREQLDPQGENPIALEPDPALRKELGNIRYKINSRGKIEVEPKKDIRARIGRSPDRADALVYAACRTTDGYDGPIDPLVIMGGQKVNVWQT